MRTIDADILKDKLDWVIDNPYIESSLGEQIIRTIDNVPTVERPHGEWIEDLASFGYVDLECSVCGCLCECVECGKQYNFCPNCGADMKKEDNEK